MPLEVTAVRRGTLLADGPEVRSTGGERRGSQGGHRAAPRSCHDAPTRSPRAREPLLTDNYATAATRGRLGLNNLNLYGVSDAARSAGRAHGTAAPPRRSAPRRRNIVGWRMRRSTAPAVGLGAQLFGACGPVGWTVAGLAALVEQQAEPDPQKGCTDDRSSGVGRRGGRPANRVTGALERLDQATQRPASRCRRPPLARQRDSSSTVSGCATTGPLLCSSPVLAGQDARPGGANCSKSLRLERWLLDVSGLMGDDGGTETEGA